MMSASIPTNFETDENEFKQYVGRKPKNQEELEDFANLLRKGIDAQLDWQILYECAAEEIKKVI